MARRTVDSSLTTPFLAGKPPTSDSPLDAAGDGSDGYSEVYDPNATHDDGSAAPSTAATPQLPPFDASTPSGGRRTDTSELFAAIRSPSNRTPSANIPRWKWWLTTPTAITANGFDVLYGFFLFYAIRGTIMQPNPETGVDEGALYNLFGQPDSDSGWHTFLSGLPYALLPAVVLNTIGDIVATTPVQDVWDILVGTKPVNQLQAELFGKGETFAAKQRWIQQNFNWFQKNVPHIALAINRALILAFNYSILALADGIAVADLGTNKVGLIVVSLIGLILGDFYYILLTDAKLKRHAVEFGARAFSTSCELSITPKLLDSPLKSLEAIMQIGSNMFYRGIAASYTTFVLGNELSMKFNGEPYTFDGDAKWIVILPGIFTAYTTAFSRLLAVTDNVFQEEVTFEEMQGAISTLASGKSVADIVFALIRTLAAYYLIEPSIGDGWAVPIAFAIFAHAIYVDSKVDLEKAVLQQRKDATPVATKDLTTMQSDKIFDLAVDHKKKEWNTRVLWVSLGARVARQVAFIGFVDTLVNGFLKGDLGIDLGLDPLGIFAVAFLAGMPIAKNDFYFMTPGYAEALAHYAVQWGMAMHGRSRQFTRDVTLDGPDDLARRVELRCLPGTVAPWTSFLWARADYRPDQLREYAEEDLGIGARL